jgi:hypothetical protein
MDAYQTLEALKEHAAGNGQVEPEPAENELDVDPSREAVTIEFENSYDYNGKTYTEITLNFPEITNRQYGKIEKDFHSLNPDLFAPVLSVCDAYLQVAASHAADVPYGLISMLKGIDATTVRNMSMQAVGKTSGSGKVRRAKTTRARSA